MDINNPVIKLCIEGTQAEFEGRLESARDLYWQAWNAAKNDYDACIAAHYVARFQKTPEDIFRWNQEALNMCRAYEVLGKLTEATRFYDLAAGLGYVHQADWKSTVADTGNNV